MNKLLLNLALASFVTNSAATLAEGPIDGSLYGKVNVSVTASDTSDGEDQWDLNSNASRLGVEGKAELGDDLYAIYKAEFEVAVDDGDNKGQTFSQRNIIAGIQGNFGTLWAGKHDTPSKMAQNKIDLFNDLEGDIKFTFEGENRQSNLIAYTSPNFNGFTATVALVPGEGDDVDGDSNGDDGIADASSYSLSYEIDQLYLAIAADKDVDFQDLLRIVAQYTYNDLTMGLMYQQNEHSQGDDILDERGYFISAAYKLGDTTLKAQYGTVEDDADNDEYDTWSLGADYKLAKSTKLFAYYTKNSETDGSAGDKVKYDYLGVGMEHKF
jgi:predicted porin